MDFILTQSLKYEERNYDSKTNSKILLPPVYIKGLRVKGNIKVSHSKDGDTTTCSIVYRTAIKIPEGSKLNGREVMESVPINSIIPNSGYLNYVK